HLALRVARSTLDGGLLGASPGARGLLAGALLLTRALFVFRHGVGLVPQPSISGQAKGASSPTKNTRTAVNRASVCGTFKRASQPGAEEIIAWVCVTLSKVVVPSTSCPDRKGAAPMHVGVLRRKGRAPSTGEPRGHPQGRGQGDEVVGGRRFE